MRTPTRRVVRLVVLGGTSTLVTLVLIPIGINVGTGGTPPAFLAPFVGWVWPAVVILSLAVIMLGAWEKLEVTRLPRGMRHAHHAVVRERIIGQVKKGVEQRMEGSLAQRAKIALELDERPTAVNCTFDILVAPVDDRRDPLLPMTDIVTAFDSLRCSLLVLGDPGAGKTTQLLELASVLLYRATQDADQPVPVLIDLAAWSASRRRRQVSQRGFRDWLITEIARRYYSSPRVAREWLEHGKLILLLDGLDEVSPEDRDKCVQEIDALHDEEVRELAVCCREGDYAAIGRKLTLTGGAIAIRPLDESTVRAHFESVAPRLNGVRAALQRDPQLWRVLDSPLMLNIMTLAYHDRPSADVPTTHTPFNLTEHRRLLFDAYVVEVLARRRYPIVPYRPERSLRAIKFLAGLAASPFWNDLIARSRLPGHQAWLNLVSPRALWLLFKLGVPATLTAAVFTIDLSIGLQFGVVPAIIQALWLLAIVLPLLRGRFTLDLLPVDSRVLRIACLACGLMIGVGIGSGISALSAALSASVGRWPTVLSGTLDLVITFVMLLAPLSLLPEDWRSLMSPYAGSLVGTCAVLAETIWLTPPARLFEGLVAGAIPTAITAIVAISERQLRDSVAYYHPTYLKEARRLSLAALLAIFVIMAVVAGVVVATGIPMHPDLLGFITGLVIGGTAALIVISSDFILVQLARESLVAFLARTLIIGQLPIRRKAFLRFAVDRSLLTPASGRFYFQHPLLRDHLAQCDPIKLGSLVAERLAQEAEEGSPDT